MALPATWSLRGKERLVGSLVVKKISDDCSIFTDWIKPRKPRYFEPDFFNKKKPYKECGDRPEVLRVVISDFFGT